MTCANNSSKNSALSAAVLQQIRFIQREFQKAERSHQAGARDDMTILHDAELGWWEFYDKLQASAVAQ